MEALTPPEGQRVAAKLVACPGLPFPDAPDLRRMHDVEFVLVAGLLGEDFFSAFEGLPEDRFQLRVPGDFTPDVADQAAKPGAQAPNPSQTLFVTACVHQARRFSISKSMI